MLDRIIKTVFPWLLTHSILCWQLLCKFDALTFYLFMGNKFNVLRPVKKICSHIGSRKVDFQIYSLTLFRRRYVCEIFFSLLVYRLLCVHSIWIWFEIYTICIRNVMHNIIHFCAKCTRSNLWKATKNVGLNLKDIFYGMESRKALILLC